jgi:hypothetical protein
MRSAITLPRIPWRGAAAFALDNVLPLLGFAALVVGAFHLPGVWGVVGGWVLAGASAIFVRHQLEDDIRELKQRAQADRIDRQRARAQAKRFQVAA